MFWPDTLPAYAAQIALMATWLLLLLLGYSKWLEIYYRYWHKLYLVDQGQSISVLEGRQKRLQNPRKRVGASVLFSGSGA